MYNKNIVGTSLLPFSQYKTQNSIFILCFRVNLGFCLAYNYFSSIKKPRLLRFSCIFSPKIIGFLLALDQVLRKPWSELTHFWTSTLWSKIEHPGGAEIADLTDFAGYVDPIRGPLGFL